MSYFSTEIIASKPFEFKYKLQIKLTELGIKYGKILDYVILDIYDDVDDLYDSMNSHTPAKERKATFCGYVDSRDYHIIHIISQDTFIKTFTEMYHLDNLQEMYWMTILHECVHSLTFNLNPNIISEADIRLVEGMAVYESGQLDYMRKYNAVKGVYYNYGVFFERYVQNNNYARLIAFFKSL